MATCSELRTLKLWYHFCPVVLNTVLLSNCVFLLKICTIITMTDFNIIKFLHALTFEMTLKAAKCHLQNMHRIPHKVSNTDNCIIVTHSSYLCLKYKFSLYKGSFWNSDHVTGKNNEPAEGLKYLVNSNTRRRRNKAAFCLPGTVFYFTQVFKKTQGFYLHCFECTSGNISGVG